MRGRHAVKRWGEVQIGVLSMMCPLCTLHRQDRKDKEKEKRMKGQSTHKEWKSEAEMMLRQQYD